MQADKQLVINSNNPISPMQSASLVGGVELPLTVETHYKRTKLMYTLTEVEKTVLKKIQLSKLEQAVYIVVKGKILHFRLRGINDVYIGAKDFDELSKQNHCTQDKIQKALIRITKMGLLYCRNNDMLYFPKDGNANGYYTVMDIPQPQIEKLMENTIEFTDDKTYSWDYLTAKEETDKELIKQAVENARKAKAKKQQPVIDSFVEPVTKEEREETEKRSWFGNFLHTVAG